MGVYCEGSGQFPPPVIAGATYAWSTGETTQRIQVVAPTVQPSTYSVTVTSPSGTTTLSATIMAAVPGPVCTVTASVPEPIAPGTTFTVTANCNPAATSYSWIARSFTGSVSIVGPTNQQSAVISLGATQPGDVVPIYLTAANAVGPGPYASLLVTAGNPAAAVTAAGIAGGVGHTCALTVAGGAKCWGDDSSGQLGDFYGAVLSRTAPVNVGGGAANLAAITAGASHSCALTSSGGVKCWGDNSRGQLGDGNTAPGLLLVDVVGLSGVTSLSANASGYHTCAITTGGALKCWGRNDFGQLGDQSTTDRNTPVSAFLNGSTAVAVSAGGAHTCIITPAGGVRCWGRNSEGQLGDGTLVSKTSPVDVVGLGSGVVAIASAYSHTCALLATGSVKCWGWNGEGELGNGTTVSSPTPVDVSGLPVVARIATGGNHTCVIASDATVRCWGRNTEGQLGDGTRTNRSAPVAIAGLANVVAIAGGGFHSCAVIVGGGVLCWGENDTGKIGDGTYASKTIPTVVLTERAARNLDANDWYLDLDPLNAATIPATFLPKLIVQSQLSGPTASSSLDVTLSYRAADYGRTFNHYVLGLVPPSFFNLVKAAPGTPPVAKIEASLKAGESLVPVQLIPGGWALVGGTLIPLLQQTASSIGAGIDVFQNVALPQIPRARFCIGYGESVDGMLASQLLSEVLSLPGATGAKAGAPCVLFGVYLDGPPASLLGTPVTFKASVVGLGPTGTVQFSDGASALLAPITLVKSNDLLSTASITTSKLTLGTHSIGAKYSGDFINNWGPTVEVIPLIHEVETAPTGSSVDLAGPASSRLGSTVSFTATVVGNNPTGTVQFSDDGTTLGAPQPVVDGVATLRTAGLGTGSHSIVAAYSGDNQNTASTSSALSHTVYAAVSTKVGLSSTPNPSLAGAGVALTATVSGVVPSGSVTFREGSSVIGTAALSNGTASLTWTFGNAGLHLITAEYSGDNSGNLPATSAALAQQVVEAAAPATSSTSLTSSNNPSSLTQPVTFTATVTGAAGIATGIMAFVDGAGVIPGCQAVPLSAGTAVCTTDALSQGSHSIVAVYSGSTSYAGGPSDLLAQDVNAGFQLLTPTPSSLDFGGQSISTTSPPLTATIANTSPASVAILGVFVGPGFALASNNCSTLAPAATCQVALTFTPTADGAIGTFLGLNYANGGPTAIKLAGTGERSLVTHYYRSILRRAPDDPGKAFWTSEAARMQSLGANVNETWYAMSMSFYTSAEYAGFARSDSDFVTDLYDTFFNRPPDGAGLAFWVGQLGSGLPREVMLASFMFSGEFTTFTQNIFGNTAARAEINAVVDFYRGVLGRLPDDSGFTFWVGQFRAAQCQGAGAVTAQADAISSAFVNGGEYAGRNRTNAQYVGDLYNAFLRRGGDLAGVRYWIGQLDSGAQTREQLRQAFIASPEFSASVNAVVAQGCLQ